MSIDTLIILILVAILLITYIVYVFWPRKIATEGTVIRKWHDSENTWTEFIPIETGRMVIPIPVFHINSENWIITIKNIQGIESDVSLSQHAWNKIEIGSHYAINGSYDQESDTVDENDN